MTYLAGRPLPVSPDGRYDTEVQPLSGTITRDDPHSDLYKTVHSIHDSFKNLPLAVTELLDPNARIARVPTSFVTRLISYVLLDIDIYRPSRLGLPPGRAR